MSEANGLNQLLGFTRVQEMHRVERGAPSRSSCQAEAVGREDDQGTKYDTRRVAAYDPQEWVTNAPDMDRNEGNQHSGRHRQHSH